MERVKPYCRFPEPKKSISIIFSENGILATNKEDSDILTQLLGKIPSKEDTMTAALQQGKIPMSEYLKFLKNKKK